MPRTVVLDANLALLLVVGRMDRNAIDRHKRLKAYESRDYDLLEKALSEYSEIVCTPNILTETSNLLRQGAGERAAFWANGLSAFVDDVTEHYVASRTVCAERPYRRLGLTDGGIIETCRRGHSLLTADFALYDAVSRAGLVAVNFNHLRTSAFDL